VNGLNASSTNDRMRARFEQIYATNEWGHGSGEGSLPAHTRQYAQLVQQFVRDKGVKTVVDLGCGDWQFSRYIDWGAAEYIGYDLVRSVVERNQETFRKPEISFQLFSGNFDDLGSADLLIVKDVLQHWSNEAVKAFLPTLRRYRYCLLTNCVNPREETTNEDIRDGDFRYLDLRLPPFNITAEEILTFSNHRPLLLKPLIRPRWTKKVLLVRGQG